MIGKKSDNGAGLCTVAAIAEGAGMFSMPATGAKMASNCPIPTEAVADTALVFSFAVHWVYTEDKGFSIDELSS